MVRERFGVARCTVAADARHGLSRCHSRQKRQDNGSGQGCAMPTGSCEPALQGTGTERAVGFRFHLCQHLVGHGLRGFRHRRLCPQDCRLARQPDTACQFVLDALEQALHKRRPAHGGGLVHHSDRGSQYVSVKYTERLTEAGIEPSVGSVGQLRQCTDRDHQWPLQSRDHPSTRAMAEL